MVTAEQWTGVVMYKKQAQKSMGNGKKLLGQGGVE